MAYSRAWLPAKLRHSVGLERRLVRAALLTVVFITILSFLQSSRDPDTLSQGPLSATNHPAGNAPWESYPDVEPIVSTQPPGARPDIRFKPSSFNWSTVSEHHPVASIRPLPTARPKQFPPTQHNFSAYVHDDTSKRRQQAVRRVFLRSWTSYKTHAWLYDELSPVTGKGKTTFGGWSATLVDALDTLWIMDLRSEFHAAAAAAAQLDWAATQDTAVNVFETTIRHLGGLLSAYDLSREAALLEKAHELGTMLYIAFDTPNRMPPFWFRFDDAKRGRQAAGARDPAASPCSLSLEFTHLALLTGDPKFADAVARVGEFLEASQGDSKLPGLWPKWIDFAALSVGRENVFTMGGLADSMYEYLPKMTALLGGDHGVQYEKMYRAAMDAAQRHLLFRPMISSPDLDPEGQAALFLGDVNVRASGMERVPLAQHLACFAGGMFALGGKLYGIPEHVGVGGRLARGCAWLYEVFPTGLMPEEALMLACEGAEGECEVDWESGKKGEAPLPVDKGVKSIRDARYILRPEAVESLFVMWRVTGEELWRERAWKMFEKVVQSTETRFANSAIADVNVAGETEKLDSMESFWLAETLKYFYLIFSPPDLISLDDYVLNTEAHPFLRPK
ncbi:glycoside hydrolase [Staphylotrichum tortipilum]|uniref:alpha-1,2-Mannosidase n=1 Tax=Staphylotrichum tortipilum TaxID=2831512 RepID=A0AAN6RVD8_9PEZI|nr:glycoside hydrolase [Staphylotrichum longicolle]